MKKPKILFVTLWDSDWMGLDNYFDVSYYNYKMPESVFYEKAKNADLIIEQEFNDSNSLYSHLMKEVKTLKAMWFVDRRGIFEIKPDYINSYDFVFMAVDGLRASSPRQIIHLPLAYNFTLDLMNRTQPDRNTDLSFVGHIDYYPQRKAFFDDFKKDLSDRKISYSIGIAGWRDYANIIQNSKVAFNKSGADECNYRVYESMGFGSILLTDYNDECNKIPELSDRVYYYKNYEDIFSQMEKIMSIPKAEYEAIVLDNQKWIMKNHLAIHRYLKIAEHSIGYKPKVN